MQGKILLIHIDRQDQRSLYRILRSTRSHLDFTDDLAECRRRLDEDAWDLLIVDHDHLGPEGVALLLELGTTRPELKILLLSQERDKQRLVELFRAPFLTNLVAKAGEIAADELVVTVEKILRNDVFGLEKYLTWGIEPELEVLTSSREKDQKLTLLASFADTLGLPSRLTTLAKGVADELLMNAVYNAPVDAEGRPRYAHLPRTERIDLGPGEEVDLRWACDGRHLAISVTDPFGSLEVNTIRQYLARCFARGDDQMATHGGGAGMGLFYIFTSLSQLIVNIDPGQRTEVIGLLDVTGSYRDFAQRPKSFNVFLQRR